MSNRKKWSLPLAFAVVLLFAGLMGASVLAQARNAKPQIATPIADAIGSTTLEITGGTPRTDNDAADAGNLPQSTTANLSNVFSDTVKVEDPQDADEEIDVEERLAFTIMTSAPNTAGIALTAGQAYSTGAAPPVGVVSEWWDGLDQAKRRAVLGASLLDNTLLDDEDDENDDDAGTCDSVDLCGDYDHDDDDETDDRRIIGRYTAMDDDE